MQLIKVWQKTQEKNQTEVSISSSPSVVSSASSGLLSKAFISDSTASIPTSSSSSVTFWSPESSWRAAKGGAKEG